MNKELINFFEDLEKENPKDYFLLKKFYYNPKSILNKTKEDVKAGIYYNKEIISKYAFNNNLLKFLDISLADDVFMDKMDYYMLISLEVLLSNMQEIVMINILNDFSYKDIYIFLKSQIKDKEIYQEKDIHIKLRSYDLTLSEEIIRRVKTNIRIEYNRSIKPRDEKEIMLHRIETDDYSDPINCVLCQCDMLKKIEILTCENRFLDIVESKLLNLDLDKLVIDIIISIILRSVRVKTGNYKGMDILFEINKIDKELINSFDLAKAKQLVSKLENKRKKSNKKIIYFPGS